MGATLRNEKFSLSERQAGAEKCLGCRLNSSFSRA
jgi:hypothetical protein